ncbi:hypothetical protein M3Y96_01002100 [Aphelenchoides besseyi]|nr:hypothetical protein M3Y96_01002100 [Aphelenchoides besseyi]
MAVYFILGHRVNRWTNSASLPLKLVEHRDRESQIEMSNNDVKWMLTHAFIYALFYIAPMSVVLFLDNGNLDDYKICNQTGVLEEVRIQIWRQKKECAWNTNVTEGTIQFIEKWGRWPQTITHVLYAPVCLTTLLLFYFAICCAHYCAYSHTLIPSHERWVSKLWVWLKVEIFAFVPFTFVTMYPAFVTSDVLDAYARFMPTYLSHYILSLLFQHNALITIEKYHRDDGMEYQGSIDAIINSLTQLTDRLQLYSNKHSQKPIYSVTIDEIGLKEHPLK